MPAIHALALAALLAAPAAPAPPVSDPGALAAALARKDWPAVEQAARAAIARDRKDPEAWSLLGAALVQQGKLDEGEKALRSGLAARDAAGLRLHLGQLLLARGRPAEAEKELLRAAKLAEGDQLYADLARAQIALGKDAAAEKSLAKARHLSPDPRAFDDIQTTLASRRARRGLKPDARQALGRAERALTGGDLAAAEAAYREVLRLAPGFGEGHHRLGRLAQARGDQAAAEKEYRAALGALAPYEVRLRADTCEGLALVLLAQDRQGDEARRWAEQAIALRGEVPGYLVVLARACEAVGDPECALDAWEKVAESPAELPPAVRERAVERIEALHKK